VGVERSLQAASKNIEDRPNFDPSFNAATFITGNPAQWFNPSMLDVPPAGTLGNTPVNLGKGPDLRNLDYSISKDTHVSKLGEGGSVEFRFEVFNIFNHPNFDDPAAGGPPVVQPHRW